MIRKRALSERTPAEYAKGLVAAATMEQLDLLLTEWEDLAPEGPALRPKTAEEFAEFRRGLLAERAGDFAGLAWAKRFGGIVLPWLMALASIAAEKYSVPWDLAMRRVLEDEGGGR